MSVNFLRDNGIKVDKQIGAAFGITKSEATKQSFANAFNYLRSAGVSDEFIATNNEKLRLSYVEGYDKARIKYLKEGYSCIKVDLKEGISEKIAQLLGSDDYRNWEVLANYSTGPQTFNKLEATKELLTSYTAE
jgi:hypothetical protein